MSEFVVVDSSVAFEWFAVDRAQDRAGAFDLLELHRASRIQLAAPTLLRLEIINGFAKRGATAEDLMIVAETLEEFSLVWFELSPELVAQAAVIAAKHRLTAYDAAFVALALSLDAELVTADRQIIVARACRLRLE